MNPKEKSLACGQWGGGVSVTGAMRGVGAVCLDPVSRGAVWLLAVGVVGEWGQQG